MRSETIRSALQLGDRLVADAKRHGIATDAFELRVASLRRDYSRAVVRDVLRLVGCKVVAKRVAEAMSS